MEATSSNLDGCNGCAESCQCEKNLQQGLEGRQWRETLVTLPFPESGFGQRGQCLVGPMCDPLTCEPDFFPRLLRTYPTDPTSFIVHKGSSSSQHSLEGDRDKSRVSGTSSRLQSPASLSRVIPCQPLGRLSPAHSRYVLGFVLCCLW